MVRVAGLITYMNVNGINYPSLSQAAGVICHEKNERKISCNGLDPAGTVQSSEGDPLGRGTPNIFPLDIIVERGWRA